MANRREVAFLEREDLCADEVASFRFSKPEGYAFDAGQFMLLTLPTEEGVQTKPFTHSQAPADPYLEVTTRLSGSAFKNALAELAPGDAVSIQGPRGRMTLHPGIEKIAFLVGGVGITPVRSVLRDAATRGRRFRDAVIFYGNRDDGCIPFGGELDALESSGVRVVHVLQNAPPGWAGESGFVTADLVRRHCDLSDARPFLVSGPPAMADAMERVLDELGVPAERRMIERFGPAAQRF